MKYYCAILLDCIEGSPFIYFADEYHEQHQISKDRSVIQDTIKTLRRANPECSYKIIEIEL